MNEDLTEQQVFDKITHQKDVYAWDFHFLGADQDAIENARGLGIAANQAYNFVPTAAGTQEVYSRLDRAVTSKRSS